MQWFDQVVDDKAGRAARVAARLGMAWQLSNEDMDRLRFPARLGRDARSSELGDSDWPALQARLAAAADAGLAEAFSRLGYYLDERGESDKAHAVYERGAQAGCPISIANCAQNYQEGICVAQDSARAFALWSQAADLGDAKSMHDCGVLAWKGEGVPQDLRRARTFFQRAVAAGLQVCVLSVPSVAGNGSVGCVCTALGRASQSWVA
jgi:TPR repeat protein